MSSFIIVFFFFFQAEDGIRDLTVTGVQTCALPICFETVVSIPVQLQQRLLGEVNLFFRSTVVLTDDMRDLLSAMARHLASAMESLRATALEREAAVAEEREIGRAHV